MTDTESVESTEDPWCDSTKPVVVPLSEIENARRLIITPDGIQPTPCIRAKISDTMETEIYLKLENFNITGSFKERGARYTMLKLTPEQKKKGVIAASLGNHSQGVSYHGMKLGIPVTVVMPVVAPIMKVMKCKRYKATVVSQGQNMADAKKIARDMAKERGITYINGYDHPHVIAGQGVIGLEILDQIGSPDAVICPCGGGGLIAGIAAAIKGKSPQTKIIGVEAEKCPGFSTALQYGRPKKTVCQTSLADGLAVSKVGYNSVATCLGKIDEMVTISESLLHVCCLTLIEYEKIVTEGAGSAPLAALLSGKLKYLKGKKVVLIISGGNIDTTTLGRVLERGLACLGRYIKCSVWINDKPGGQTGVLDDIATLGINIKHFNCERAWVADDVFTVKLNLVCETRDVDNAMELRSLLASKYKVEFVDFPNPCRASRWSKLLM